MLTPKCLCGRSILIRWGTNTRRCPSCGVTWKRDKAGYWAIGFFTVLFTPKEIFLAKATKHG